MGVSFNSGMYQDNSYLFQGLSGGSGDLNYLSDYASIKNGSYGKLLKSYYSSMDSSASYVSEKKTRTSNVLDQILEEKKHPKVSKEAEKANSNLTAGLSKLTNSVSALQNADTYAVLEDGKSAEDKVASAVKDFVAMYNSVVGAAKDSTLAGKTAHVAGMMKSTQANSGKLSEIGITINRDGTLQLNEGKLKETDISKVQKLFSGDDVTSYGSSVMARLGFASASSRQAASTDKTGTDHADAQQDNVVKNGAAQLKETIKQLTSGSLFGRITGEDGTQGYDVEKIFAAVKDFAGNYNRMLDVAENFYNSGVTANLNRILEKTAQNKDALLQFGISVDEKGRIKVDEDAFKKSDMAKFQDFFSEYGSSIATNVSLVNYYMTTQAGAANGYTSSGSYHAQDNTSSYDVTS